MTKKVHIPIKLTIEHRAIPHLFKNEVYEWIKDQKVALVSGSGKTRQVTDQIIDVINEQASGIQVMTCKENSLDAINDLERRVLEDPPDMIFGVGGGKALDVSKVLGTRSNVPVVLFPTAVSSDAICSPVAVIKMLNKSTSIGVKMPQAVVIDLDLLASCPPRMMSAGIGDLLSNKSALFDWNLAHRAGKEEMNTFARLMADNAADSFLNVLNREEIDQSRLMKTAAESLIMSGIAMSIAGSSRPCSGSEHLISHALDYHCGAKALHGEQVAIGVLFAQYLQGKRDHVEPLLPYYEKLGLPTHYSDLGYTREEMHRAIRKAPSMRNRYTVFNEWDLTDETIDKMLDDVYPDHAKNRYQQTGSSAG
ncbi:MAG: iron-containing alcohol dehydrogenase family protein [Firmicutes bacterium]|uniref:Glycerol-1-phosphate dehydrogenase [NAD(P)+] n=1 Tax=Melghirimyces thermohalophilus TaxID=1236220 RepID=A0A1G6PT36_9BACL|nr:iron-containing alcohol dehydrogenase family protein [Melghirimyces thermohalophilus]MDA8352270.1 iron-containing alcohol dehydrogenase family protein [Bacillota bacterium]SDC83131.1 glycerol-1-phosphate dehydrogenase [NAD(P)+] [Melghirimyces thermohalophilus]